ncbi:MAG: hypothetical protein ISR51_09455 [Rhodospirillales bacterium]|nr:hypothetical protein [Alphaproteobacteria bacterium]MBL6948886.1 hypothetical protein [Rhodospirillales bacterium]
MTHQSIRRYVEQTQGGDWVAYLNQLQIQNETLANIQDRGKGAVIKYRGRKIRLAGKNLAKYIWVSSKRLSVVACLAERDDANMLDDFSTAAGTPSDDPPPPLENQPAGKDLGRTYVTLPGTLMAKLRKKAVRQSLKDARKKNVNDLIVEMLHRGIKKHSR